MPLRHVVRLPHGRLVIREAVAADAAALLALREAVIAEDRYFITAIDELVWTLEHQERQLDDLARRVNSLALVATLDRAVVGLAVMDGGPLRRLQHVARLEIIVAAAARDRGVGGHVMRAACAWAEENPAVHKLALCVFADNPRAVSLYERLGFEHEGRRVAEYRERDGRYRDDLLMARWVGPDRGGPPDSRE